MFHALQMKFDGLLDAHDVATDAVETCLHFAQTIVQIGLIDQQLLVCSIQRALIGNHGLNLNLQRPDHLLFTQHIVVQRTPAQGIKLRGEVTFLHLILFKFFR